MKRYGRFGGALVCSTVFAAWVGGCYNASESEAPAVRGDRTATDGGTESSTASGGTCTPGLPSDVAQFLATNCQSCHSAHPSAPMPLMTYDDLQAPARSDATKKVYELALERISSAAKPMPQTGQLAAGEIKIFSAWVAAGTPKTECATTSDAAGGAGPECAMASDCPGVLVCRQGVCDVECVSDKDCTSTWTCDQTRCTPPAASVTPTYNTVSTAGTWSTTSIASAAGQSYSGTAFDGHYVYFAPQSSGMLMRYDTRVGFTSSRAFETFDLTTLASTAQGYRGVVFDGRFVYLVPSGSSATLARFDTQGVYTDPASWTLFDLTTVSSAVGFSGASFDGRYVYLVPTDSAVALQYDTAGPVTSATSWSTFRISTTSAGAVSFAGAVSTGRYVYFVPNGGSAGPRGVLARYDAEAPFASASSWAAVDLAGINPSAKGYRTGAFDGRYLYLVPGWTAPTPSWATSTIARYDTKGSLSASTSWTFFDTSTVAPGASGFNAAAFDGRYLTLAPGYNGSVYHGVTLSYDTTADLKLATAWSAFDITSLNSSAKNLRGASFDGRFVYYAPASGVIARFEARPFSAGAGLPFVGGSFY